MQSYRTILTVTTLPKYPISPENLKIQYSKRFFTVRWHESLFFFPLCPTVENSEFRGARNLKLLVFTSRNEVVFFYEISGIYLSRHVPAVKTSFEIQIWAYDYAYENAGPQLKNYMDRAPQEVKDASRDLVRQIIDASNITETFSHLIQNQQTVP